MASRNKRTGISWELIGLVAVLGIVVAGGLILLTQKPDSTQLQPPVSTTLDPSIGLDKPDMSGVDADGRPYLGKTNAPATVYVFSDFQCPHCRDYALYVGKAIEKDLVATGKAKMVWVDFPFMSTDAANDESMLAAKAANCAGQQGRFWDMHDWLYTNQATVANTGGFRRDRLVEIATKAGLDATKFNACMDDPATEAHVKKDKDFGLSKSVSSTPSFFMVGQDRLFEGTASDQLQGLRDAIEAASPTG
jgi:protein-disulfide isomerase